MARIHVGSAALQPVLANPAQSVATSFAAPEATATKPVSTATVGILNCEKDPPQFINLIPFGVGANDTTFTVRLVGWKLVEGTLWVPQVICEFLATLSTFVGIADGVVTEAQKFADTVGDPTTNLGRENVDCWKRSPANNTPAQYKILNPGCVLFRVDINVGVSATSGNALIGTE